MNHRTAIAKPRVLAYTAVLVYLAAGLPFLPRLGLENDESLFAAPLFAPKSWHYRIRLFHSDFPLLLMSYLGTLKTFLYQPLFHWFGTGILVARLPMLLAGALSVWLFYLFLRRIADERTALVGCWLLAADSLFLLTACFDWGPVALQHLLVIAGLLLVVRFYQERRDFSLFAGFFFFGLAVWDKALAFWILSGCGIAAVVTVPRQILATLNLRRIGLAAAGFILGAAPFFIYNVTHGFDTLRQNATRDFSDLPGRARLLLYTLDGRGLFGWMFEEDPNTPHPHVPSDALERLSAGISTFAGHPRTELMVYALILAVLLAPLARGPSLRAILFALVAWAVAWIQMATTAGAGGSVHHVILLWPLPAMLVAVSLGAASRRLGKAGLPVLAAVTIVLIGADLLVTNEYYTVMARNGGTPNWSSAMFTLSRYMQSTSASSVSCVDWGIMDSLRLLNRGKLPLRWGGDEPDSQLADILADPGGLFLGHSPGRETFPGKTAAITARATRLGFRREVIAVISDPFGRPTFEIFRFHPVVEQALPHSDSQHPSSAIKP